MVDSIFVPIDKVFTRKGALRDNKSRMMITYEQLKDSGTGVYIYKCDYDGAVHYTTFISVYLESGEFMYELFPGEYAFDKGTAVNTRDFYEAQDIYWELVKKKEEEFA